MSGITSGGMRDSGRAAASGPAAVQPPPAAFENISLGAERHTFAAREGTGKDDRVSVWKCWPEAESPAGPSPRRHDFRKSEERKSRRRPSPRSIGRGSGGSSALPDGSRASRPARHAVIIARIRRQTEMSDWRRVARAKAKVPLGVLAPQRWDRRSWGWKRAWKQWLRVKFRRIEARWGESRRFGDIGRLIAVVLTTMVRKPAPMLGVRQGSRDVLPTIEHRVLLAKNVREPDVAVELQVPGKDCGSGVEGAPIGPSPRRHDFRKSEERKSRRRPSPRSIGRGWEAAARSSMGQGCHDRRGTPVARSHGNGRAAQSASQPLSLRKTQARGQPKVSTCRNRIITRLD
jgi:hypothetical protein